MNEQKKMRAINTLTKEQIAMLKDNPCVASLTSMVIHWNSKFLNDVCTRYDCGEHLPEILKEYDIDPKILGDSKMATIRNYYRQKWLPLHSQKANPTNTIAISDKSSRKSKLSKLEHDVAYLGQEVEFLKKIFIANNKHLAPKHRQQKSIK